MRINSGRRFRAFEHTSVAGGHHSLAFGLGEMRTFVRDHSVAGLFRRSSVMRGLRSCVCAGGLPAESLRAMAGTAFTRCTRKSCGQPLMQMTISGRQTTAKLRTIRSRLRHTRSSRLGKNQSTDALPLPMTNLALKPSFSFRAVSPSLSRSASPHRNERREARRVFHTSP